MVVGKATCYVMPPTPERSRSEATCYVMPLGFCKVCQVDNDVFDALTDSQSGKC